MPKKTKKEKIIALYRKKLKLIQQPPLSTTDKQKAVINEISKKITPTQKPRLEQTEEDLLTKKYFKADLTKSLVVISLIIIVEICLYFVNIKNYF